MRNEQSPTATLVDRSESSSVHSTSSDPMPSSTGNRKLLVNSQKRRDSESETGDNGPLESSEQATAHRISTTGSYTSTNNKETPIQSADGSTAALSKRTTEKSAELIGSTSFSHHRQQIYEGQGTVESPYIVDFDPTGDRENPLEWSNLRKWYITGVVSMGTLVVAFGSSVYAGAIPQMLVYFEQTQTVLTLGLTTYVLGFAFGPLLWAPLSELYGRRTVLLPTYSLFTLFHIGCALAQNLETVLICRFLSGFFGSAPLTNSGGVISDIWDSKTRALALAWFSLSPFAGPVLGPIIGGFMGMNKDWRIIFWLLFAFAALLLGFAATVPETYAPVILRKRALKLSKATGQHYISHHDLLLDADETLSHKLRVNVSRPFIFLVFEPIVSFMAIYAAIVYATLYMLFPSFPIIFAGVRGWNLGESGLPFIGVGVGMLFGILLNIFYVNPKYVRDLDAAGGELPPEARLPMCCIGGLCLPVGLFWFAWTVQPEIHWIVPIIATMPFGFGMVIVFLSMMSYIVDSYLWLCASALAANTVIRSICGATFPLFAKGLFNNLGLNWGLTLIAFLSLAMAPIPFVFLRYGEKIRSFSKYAPGHPEPSSNTSLPSSVVKDIQEEDLQHRQMKEVDRRSVLGREQV